MFRRWSAVMKAKSGFLTVSVSRRKSISSTTMQDYANAQIALSGWQSFGGSNCDAKQAMAQLEVSPRRAHNGLPLFPESLIVRYCQPGSSTHFLFPRIADTWSRSASLFSD